MQVSSTSRTASKSIEPASNQLSTPTPYLLRCLIFDYLYHNCHTATARAFLKDSTVRHLDADGDEIMQPERSQSDDTPGELNEDELRQLEIREGIQTAILSGRMDDATALLNEHFPSVLCENNATTARTPTLSTAKATVAPDDGSTTLTPSAGKEMSSSFNRWGYIAPTSVEPIHLSLTLRISSFIEACRTVPLPYTPPNPSCLSSLLPHVPQPQPPLVDYSDAEVVSRHQAELLEKAQKLHAAVSMLQNPADKARYEEEIRNVGGLLLYKVPEESPLANYLSQMRRVAVADQINRAVLQRLGRPVVSDLELYARYTSTVWSLLNNLRVKPPPISARPAGVRIPPAPNKPAGKNTEEILPHFDLQLFLDSKT